VRQSFAHQAELVMDSDGDTRSPGGAITVALCGHWDHQPPCPLAPHHTSADRVGEVVHIRVLFAAEPERADEVRRRIDDALRGGSQRGPDGVVTRWAVVTSGNSAVSADEHDHAERLARS
jgi:hypothetical protein